MSGAVKGKAGGKISKVDRGKRHDVMEMDAMVSSDHQETTDGAEFKQVSIIAHSLSSLDQL